jgi:capsular polysaccharide transport system permease protein
MKSIFSRAALLRKPLFFTAVVLPTIVSAMYFGVLASDVYISESQFVVRSPDKPAQTGLGVLLKSTGFANSGDEIYSAKNFIESRDALAALNKNNYLYDIYTAPAVSLVDRFNSWGSAPKQEKLFVYYLNHVEVAHDTTSSIVTLKVRAYTSRDAYQVNERLLQLAEDLVNRLNERGRKDMIGFAQREVADAEARATRAALALSAFRNAKGVVDPEKQATVQLQMISKLQDEVIATETQLAQLRIFTPQNPQIPTLQAQVRELNRQIASQSSQITGNQHSLAGVAAEYQRRQLESQFADRQLAAAMASLQEAQNEARRKQAYVERIVQPSRPDKAMEPRRLRGIFVTFAMGLVAWGILSMLLAGVREHKA